MNIPEAALARKGKSIYATLRALYKWVRDYQVHAGDGISLIQTSSGIHVSADFDVTWDERFKVRVPGILDGQAEITVAYGAITIAETNQVIVPWLPVAASDENDPRRIDGTDADYIDLDQGIPRLTIDTPQNGRSFVGLELVREPEQNAYLDDVDHVRITHRLEDHTETSDVETAFSPLAILYWRDGTLQRTRQIPLGHLTYHRRPPSEENDRPAEHHFSGR